MKWAIKFLCQREQIVLDRTGTFIRRTLYIPVFFLRQNSSLNHVIPSPSHKHLRNGYNIAMIGNVFVYFSTCAPFHSSMTNLNSYCCAHWRYSCFTIYSSMYIARSTFRCQKRFASRYCTVSLGMTLWIIFWQLPWKQCWGEAMVWVIPPWNSLR